MHGEISEYSAKKDIVNRFIKKFVKDGFYFLDNEIKSKNLLWCSFIGENFKVIPTQELDKIKLPSNNDLYFYIERTEKLYKTNIFEIHEFINSLEPWEDIDAEIFDETMSWVIAITHEDFSILLGFKD